MLFLTNFVSLNPNLNWKFFFDPGSRNEPWSDKSWTLKKIFYKTHQNFSPNQYFWQISTECNFINLIFMLIYFWIQGWPSNGLQIKRWWIWRKNRQNWQKLNKMNQKNSNQTRNKIILTIGPDVDSKLFIL
jgi:hypothetical protein